jgi:cytidylate kinase
MAIITIRGQMGSGAPAIGSLIADDLGYDYVDREIIAKVAAMLNRRKSDIEEKEMPASGFLGRIAEALEHGYSPGVTADGKFIPVFLPPIEVPLDREDYLVGLTSVIRDLSSKGSIVICGRGSQFILEDRLDAFHVLVIAPLETRIKRVMEESRLLEEAAKKRIADYDSSRREFIKRYFRTELEDPMHYDLVINTRRLSFEEAASLVVLAIRRRTEQAATTS